MQSAFHSVVGPKKEIYDLNGKVLLVTGSASGIGFVNCICLAVLLAFRCYQSTNVHTYVVARAFVFHGASVIMVNRKEEQGQDTIKKLRGSWREC
jgi:hypothetical protein